MAYVPPTTSSSKPSETNTQVVSVGPDSTASGLSHAQAVRDALADAETLREFQRNPYPPHLLLRVLALNLYQTEVGALRCGIDLDLWKRGHFYETERALVDDAVWAARAAFRAVPGLRDDYVDDPARGWTL